jgi:RNA-directed DNA polymerase
MKERITVQTSLLGIAKKAKSDKRYRFRNLYRELNEELLLDSWRLLRKDAALGVGRAPLNMKQTSRRTSSNWWQRLKRKRYRVRLVRRHYIPKGNGGVRPLGIPATKDSCCNWQ